MKRKILLIIVLILLLIGALLVYKHKLNSKQINDISPQEEIQTEEVLDNVENTDNTKEEIIKQDKTQQKSKKNIESTKLEKPLIKQPLLLPENAVEKKVEKKVSEPGEEYKKTRSDVVDVSQEYIPSKNSGSVYYRGVFYDIKVRQMNLTQDNNNIQVITSEQHIKITPTVNDTEKEKQVQDIKNVGQQTEIEQKANNVQKNTSALEKEVTTETEVLKLDKNTAKPVLLAPAKL